MSDGSFLRRRTQLFIAYLYKPEAQAKVLQIHVYYSHIIPSLALQACKTRNTIKSRFPNPQLIANKGARAPSASSGPVFCTVSELAELAVDIRDRGSVRSVSLPNWRLISGTGKSLRYACICPEGAKCDSPGQRPGKMPQ